MIMQILIILLLLLTTNSLADLNSKWRFQREEKLCKIDLDCNQCLRLDPCSWCSVNEQSLCVPRNICPTTLQYTSCPKEPEGLEEQLQKLYQENQIILDVPQVTLNATYLCHLRNNCSTCTEMGFCAWCTDKKSCVPYSGALTATLCGSKSWTAKQCVSKGAQSIKPCSIRKSGCKECVVDDFCYWCDSTKQCHEYKGSGAKNIQCSRDKWFYRRCTKTPVLTVLIPILIIIAIPVIAYVLLICVTSIMKEAGYNVLNDSDSSDDEDKIRKPIMLRHDSPGSKTDSLKKKYGLDKNP